MRAPGRSAPHCSDRVPARTATALPLIARPSPCPTQPPLALATTASLLEGFHAPAPTAPTTQLVLGHRTPAQPLLPVPESIQPAPGGRAPALRCSAGTPPHTPRS